MSEDNQIENVGPDGQESQVTDTAATAIEATPASDAIKELEAKLSKAAKDLENARRGEKFAKSTKEDLQKRVDELEAQGEYKTKYEQAVAKMHDMALDGALTEAAKAAKAKSIPAVLKLIDRSVIEVKDGQVDTKSVQTAIAKAKQDYDILFEAVELPPTGRAAEGEVTSGYDKEIRAAKSQAELIAVMKRYNKI